MGTIPESLPLTSEVFPSPRMRTSVIDPEHIHPPQTILNLSRLEYSKTWY
jgi:hypothetical protein